MQSFIESHRPRERYSLFRYRKGDRPPMPSIPDVSPSIRKQSEIGQDLAYFRMADDDGRGMQLLLMPGGGCR
jgi:hypothetical protein